MSRCFVALVNGERTIISEEKEAELLKFGIKVERLSKTYVSWNEANYHENFA